jgi:hypothetical protein
MSEALDIRTQDVIHAAKKFLTNSHAKDSITSPELIQQLLDVTHQAQKPEDVYLVILNQPVARPLLFSLQDVRSLATNDVDSLRLFSKFLGYVHWKMSVQK